MKEKMVLTAFLLVGLAVAQEGLYDPAPPANSAFVRAFNLDAASHELSIGKKAFGKLNTLSASAYLIVPEGKHNALLNKSTQGVEFKAGKYYTVFLKGGKVQLLEDESNTNRAKALITVYNLTDSKDISLKTADGKVTVVKDIDLNKSKSQAVNGIKVALSVLNDTKTIEAFKETQLERGAAYSVFVTGSKGNYKATWVQATTTTR